MVNLNSKILDKELIIVKSFFFYKLFIGYFALIFIKNKENIFICILNQVLFFFWELFKTDIFDFFFFNGQRIVVFLANNDDFFDILRLVNLFDTLFFKLLKTLMKINIDFLIQFLSFLFYFVNILVFCFNQNLFLTIE